MSKNSSNRSSDKIGSASDRGPFGVASGFEPSGIIRLVNVLDAVLQGQSKLQDQKRDMCLPLSQTAKELRSASWLAQCQSMAKASTQSGLQGWPSAVDFICSTRLLQAQCTAAPRSAKGCTAQTPVTRPRPFCSFFNSSRSAMTFPDTM